MLKTSDFDYQLPEDLIASHPSDKRDHSRLMVLDRSKHSIEHKSFFNIIDHLNQGDLLVLNDTKVIPARLIGKKISGGPSTGPSTSSGRRAQSRRSGLGGKADILLLKKVKDNVWECLAQPAKRLKKGYELDFGRCKAKITEEVDDSRRIIEFYCDGSFDELIKEIGSIPLPPYIVAKLSEKQKKDKNLTDRYQTVYADKAGASAAPTAGLHFTTELLKKIKDKGVSVEYITLHTGVGTFRPVMADNVEEHKMFSEEYEISERTAKEVASKKGRIIAVGTTVTRAMEDCFSKHGKIIACKDEAKIFIYPPYKFNVIDSLITNFHFPRSTLLMLVSAFAGREFILDAYKSAIEKKYRFYSFGDAMMIK